MTRVVMRAGEWEPDTNLVACGLAGALRAEGLSGPDRAWVVAGLTAAGLTAAETAKRLKCSLRLIMQIRVEPMTVVATYALGLLTELEDTNTLLVRTRKDMTREISRAAAELNRCKAERKRLLDERSAAFKQQVMELWQQGLTQKQIAQQLGVYQPGIALLLRQKT